MREKTNFPFRAILTTLKLQHLFCQHAPKREPITKIGSLFLYNENHAIVAWFKRGSADEKKSSKYDIISSTCQSKLKNIFGGFIYEKS